ncbi:hypothetical protein SODALDRAFT_355366 [Sodiomyces alkalinus F11]|uniref:Uncharacterized protein n=1 Tax=Sodiomyces alkalinus (strain CBS 110278 / VKM F-3762 / F11) TaxID=1314773 RepID=A0A3N2Q8R5_SODAK|nr:hypothetical protein SODALDRAFT_355366 [Sodiomyces alkalinus F11]ROT43171.1 hypothetical protein SODALDRAFT_355366 [Sodiomyces alkalinus F11]
MFQRVLNGTLKISEKEPPGGTPVVHAHKRDHDSTAPSGVKRDERFLAPPPPFSSSAVDTVAAGHLQLPSFLGENKTNNRTTISVKSPCYHLAVRPTVQRPSTTSPVSKPTNKRPRTEYQFVGFLGLCGIFLLAQPRKSTGSKSLSRRQDQGERASTYNPYASTTCELLDIPAEIGVQPQRRACVHSRTLHVAVLRRTHYSEKSASHANEDVDGEAGENAVFRVCCAADFATIRSALDFSGYASKPNHPTSETWSYTRHGGTLRTGAARTRLNEQWIASASEV